MISYDLYICQKDHMPPQILHHSNFPKYFLKSDLFQINPAFFSPKKEPPSMPYLSALFIIFHAIAHSSRK